MADRRYLKRRGETWHYQRTVPAAIRKRGHGPNPIIEALGTRDLTEAQALRWKVNAKWQAQFDKVAGRQSPKLPTSAEIEAEALEEFHTTLHVLDEIGVSDEAGLAQLIAANQRKLDLADPSKINPDLAKVHPSLGPGRPNRIVDRDYALIRARIAAIEARRKALAGVVPEIPQSFGRNSVDPVTLRPVLPRKGDKAGPKFADVAARFIAERQRDPTAKLTEQTREQLETAFRLFDSWAKQPCLGDIDRRAATSFLDTIAKLNPMWGRSGETKDRSFEEIFKMSAITLAGSQTPPLADTPGRSRPSGNSRPIATGSRAITLGHAKPARRAASAGRMANAHSPEPRLPSSLSASPQSRQARTIRPRPCLG